MAKEKNEFNFWKLGEDNDIGGDVQALAFFKDEENISEEGLLGIHHCPIGVIEYDNEKDTYWDRRELVESLTISGRERVDNYLNELMEATKILFGTFVVVLVNTDTGYYHELYVESHPYKMGEEIKYLMYELYEDYCLRDSDDYERYMEDGMIFPTIKTIKRSKPKVNRFELMDI